MNPTYPELLRLVHGQGAKVSPRGEETTEVLAGGVTLRAGEMPDRKGYNPLLGIAEMLMLIGGTFDVKLIEAVAPKADLSLFTPQAAYGPRIDGQMQGVVDELQADPLSRRAVVVLPNRAKFGTFNNEPLAMRPCTTSIQFLRRAGVLHAVVNMRSWDLIYGLPYDVVMFGGLTMAVARAVSPGLQAGYVFVTAGSMHVYTKTAHLGETAGEYGEFSLKLPSPINEWSRAQQWANHNILDLEKKVAIPDDVMVKRS